MMFRESPKCWSHFNHKIPSFGEQLSVSLDGALSESWQKNRSTPQRKLKVTAAISLDPQARCHTWAAAAFGVLTDSLASTFKLILEEENRYQNPGFTASRFIKRDAEQLAKMSLHQSPSCQISMVPWTFYPTEPPVQPLTSQVRVAPLLCHWHGWAPMGRPVRVGPPLHCNGPLWRPTHNLRWLAVSIGFSMDFLWICGKLTRQWWFIGWIEWSSTDLMCFEWLFRWFSVSLDDW